MLLVIGAACLGAIVLAALVTGWVWIPGARGSSGSGYWSHRADDMGGYVTYVVIISLAALGVLAMAVHRMRRFKRQTQRRS